MDEVMKGNNRFQTVLTAMHQYIDVSIERAIVEAFYALTCARLGLTDEAITRIERLLTTPFAVDYADESITLNDLRQRWEWDPLRNHPRFQKILAGPEPKTVYK